MVSNGKNIWPITILALAGLIGSFVLLYFNRDVTVASSLAVAIVSGFLVHSNSQLMSASAETQAANLASAIAQHTQTLLSTLGADTTTPTTQPAAPTNTAAIEGSRTPS